MTTGYVASAHPLPRAHLCLERIAGVTRRLLVTGVAHFAPRLRGTSEVSPSSGRDGRMHIGQPILSRYDLREDSIADAAANLLHNDFAI